MLSVVDVEWVRAYFFTPEAIQNNTNAPGNILSRSSCYCLFLKDKERYLREKTRSSEHACWLPTGIPTAQRLRDGDNLIG